MAILHGEDIANSQQLLLDVFRDGYAGGYVGDEKFLQGYLLPAHAAILDDHHQDLRGAALMRNSRLTAITTRTDREKYGSRFQNLVGLLQIAHAVDDGAWMGIGVNAKNTVRLAGHQAGMAPSKDEELLKTRLMKSGKIGSYAIRSAGEGLQISLAGSNHGLEYWQEVWDWNAR